MWVENHENRANNWRTISDRFVCRVTNGRTEFWRVRLGKRFTRGAIVTRHFSNLDEARKWIFGDAQDVKNELPHW
jgi:hypothetical protein